jgi:type II secretory pathway pseudopilin PulG
MSNDSIRGLRKYQIGLAILGVITVAMTSVVLVQAGDVKADGKTYAAAQQAATSLENYISSKQSVPASLSAAGVKDLPGSITYTKLSDSSYKFCATYRSASNASYSAGDLTSSLLTGQYSTQPSSQSYGTDSQSTLLITSDHKKGDNCQTIKPSLYNSYNYSSSNALLDPSGGSTTGTSQSVLEKAYAACDKQYPNPSQNTDYYACLNKADTASKATSTASRLHR